MTVSLLLRSLQLVHVLLLGVHITCDNNCARGACSIIAQWSVTTHVACLFHAHNTGIWRRGFALSAFIGYLRQAAFTHVHMDTVPRVNNKEGKNVEPAQSL